MRGIFKRGPIFWGRVQVNGRDIKWSLRTRELDVAVKRYRAGRQHRLSKIRSNGIRSLYWDKHPDIEGHVYFIEDGSFIKIGHSLSVERRIVSLQTSSARSIRLIHFMPGSPKLERALHKRFRRLRVRGEWFKKGAELLAFIAEARVEQQRQFAVPQNVPVETVCSR